MFAGIAPARHPVDPEKSNKVMGFPTLVTGLCQFYGVLVAPSKVIRPPTNRAFIKKYCVPRQAHGETPQQSGDGRQRATDAPPSPLEFASAHPQKLERCLRPVVDQQATKSKAKGKQSTRSVTDKS